MMPTKIEWTDETWNPVTGCTPISEGCRNCYARRMAQRLAGRFGYPADEPFRVTLHEDRLAEPLRWRKPRKVFVCSMGDLFHKDVPPEFIYKVFGVMALAQRHTFQVLTKRPRRMFDVLSHHARANVNGVYRTNLALQGKDPVNIPAWPLPNIWLGVTAENQDTATMRVKWLLQTPAAVRFVSVEPMLGSVEFGPNALGYYTEAETVTEWYDGGHRKMVRPGRPLRFRHSGARIDWVICGGETGPGARPMHPDWVESLRDQCVAADVPFFFKRWGRWRLGLSTLFKEKRGGKFVWSDGMIQDDYKSRPGYNMHYMEPVGRKHPGRLLDGELWEQYPEVNP